MATINGNLKMLIKERGKNIKRLREEAGLTQAQLAKIARIGKNYLSAIETGVRNPGRKSITGICYALNVEEQTLLYGRSEPQYKGTAALLHRELDECLAGCDEGEVAIMAGELLKFIRSHKGRKRIKNGNTNHLNFKTRHKRAA